MIIKAEHDGMVWRGVLEDGAKLVTRRFLGALQDGADRRQLFGGFGEASPFAQA